MTEAGAGGALGAGDPERRSPASAGRPRFSAYTAALAAILVLAAFTRFFRLGTPDQCYFDEVYFPTTGAEILHGDDKAWEWFGHENTHPPLSKELMALGQGIFGKEDRKGQPNQCWNDAEDADKKSDPDWQYKPFGWRFFGALAGVGSVLFIYLLGKRLFRSEIAGLSAAFLLTVEGLAFVQSRIATPDTYVLFFVLGCVYFLVTNRFLLSGIFFGAGVATKWNATFVGVPIVLYFLWRAYQAFRRSRGGQGPERWEKALPVGLGLLYGGIGLTMWRYVATKSGETYDPVGTPLNVLATGLLVVGAAAAVWGLSRAIAGRRPGAPWFSPAGRAYVELAVAFGVFFVLVPVYVYLLTYVPMLMNGHSPADVRDLNRLAYDFHSHCRPPGCAHSYSSTWAKWPPMVRPIYLYVGDGNAKIYSMGNPIIFWFGIPALLFAAYQGLKNVRAWVNGASGTLRIWGRLEPGQPAILFVVLGYLGFWLPWAIQPRIMFLYHYLPALAFLVLALGYAVHWLWSQRLSRDVVLACAVLVMAAALNRFADYEGASTGFEYLSWLIGAAGVLALILSLARLRSLPEGERSEGYGRAIALVFLAVAGVTFVYLYPHLAAVPVSGALDESYYWFDSWR